MATDPNAGPYTNYSAGWQEAEERPLDYRRYFFLFKSNLHIIATFFVIVVTFAFIYASKIQDLYRSTTQVIVERPRSTYKGEDTEDVTSEAFQDEYYNTQIEIIKSNAVLKQVVDDLRLMDYFETNDEEKAVQRLFSMVKIARIKQSRLFEISVTAPEAQFAADAANAVANSFIRKNFEDLLYYSKELLSWLPEQNAGRNNIVIKDSSGGLKEMSRDELIESLPSIRTDPTLRQLREKQSEMQFQLDILLKQYREKHPSVMKARSQLKFLGESIDSEKNRIIDGLKAKASGTLQVSLARVIEEAQPADSPLPTNRMRIVIMAGIAELLLSMLFIVLIDFFDPTIHTMEDLERKGVMLPFLGPIPLIKKKTRDAVQKAIIGYYERNSDVSEAFRYLRVAINFSSTPDSLKNLVFTSCLPHEGKSFISDNLAISFALDGNRTLLIDADLRRPTLHRIFRVDNKVGLSNFLTSNLEFDAVLKETFVENLMVISSGPTSPNPGEILGSDKMKKFLVEARSRFDRIIIDCPPLTGIGDGFVIGNLTGHVILVVGARKTPVDLIRHIEQQLQKANIKIIGVVLNMVDIERERYHGYSKYYYHVYNRYYSSSSQ